MFYISDHRPRKLFLYKYIYCLDIPISIHYLYLIFCLYLCLMYVYLYRYMYLYVYLCLCFLSFDLLLVLFLIINIFYRVVLVRNSLLPQYLGPNGLNQNEHILTRFSLAHLWEKMEANLIWRIHFFLLFNLLSSLGDWRWLKHWLIPLVRMMMISN